MKLELQFKLPSGMALPGEAADVHITVAEGAQAVDQRQPCAANDSFYQPSPGDRIGATVALDVIREGRAIELRLVPAELDL